MKEGRFLDWPSEGKKKIVDAGVQAIHIWAAESLKEIFEILGEKDRAAQCEEDLKRLRSYETDPEDYKQAAALLVMVGAKDAKETNEKLLKTGGAKGMSTFMGYYILTARAMAGDYEGCLEAIREYWGGMLSLGATTFWEDFDVDWMKDAARIDELPKEGQIDVHGAYGRFCYKGYRHSLCHGWASGVTPWLSENVLGVKILEPGCKKIKVEPHLGDLEWAKGTYPTPYGEITVSHVKQADGSLLIENLDSSVKTDIFSLASEESNVALSNPEFKFSVKGGNLKAAALSFSVSGIDYRDSSTQFTIGKTLVSINQSQNKSEITEGIKITFDHLKVGGFLKAGIDS